MFVFKKQKKNKRNKYDKFLFTFWIYQREEVIYGADI